MADILIRGMEMPQSCARCDFSAVVPGEVWCKRAKKIVPDEQATNVKRHPAFCPLHELPEHGDLVDADELKAVAYERGKEHQCVAFVDPLDITLSPVIVPSNKEESE